MSTCMTEQLAFGSQQLMIVVLEHIAHSIATGSVVHFRSPLIMNQKVQHSIVDWQSTYRRLLCFTGCYTSCTTRR